MKSNFTVTLSLVFNLLILASASGQFNELKKFRSTGAEPGDEFGYSVAIDGNLAIYGAPGRAENGEESGAAYIVDIATGNQLMKLMPNDGTTEDRFGTSVAIDGNLAIVGSAMADAAGSDSGAAYIFDISNGQQLHKVVGDTTNPGDEFGIAVDIKDGTAIVGAHFHNEGRAYLFNTSNGQQVGTLKAEDGEFDDRFGIAVSLDGGKALVGARYDDDLGPSSGSAYIFDVSSGQQIHKLNSHDGFWGDRFGMYLDMEGNTAIVASRYDDDNLKSSGSAYLFNVDDGKERFKIVADDADPNDHFGSSVSVSGNYAIVGAVNDASLGNFSGSAYVYDVRTGLQLTKLNASDGAFFDQFGQAVAIDGSRAVVGAPQLLFGGNGGDLPSGKGYVFSIPEPTGQSVVFLAAMFIWSFGRKKRQR